VPYEGGFVFERQRSSSNPVYENNYVVRLEYRGEHGNHNVQVFEDLIFDHLNRLVQLHFEGNELQDV